MTVIVIFFKLVGLGFDGCSITNGKENGVHTRIKKNTLLHAFITVLHI